MPIKASISFEMPWNEMRMKDLPKQAFHLKCALKRNANGTLVGASILFETMEMQ